MVRGDKEGLSAVSSPTDESEEIDRIMKEIEDLEKKMDAPPESEATQPTVGEGSLGGPLGGPNDFQSAKVVALRPEVPETMVESIAETDAVPSLNEPLIKDTSTSGGEGALSMKIGGCTEVSLEFTRSGLTVSLVCSEDSLCITTDQGAEFRIPFKRAA